MFATCANVVDSVGFQRLNSCLSVYFHLCLLVNCDSALLVLINKNYYLSQQNTTIGKYWKQTEGEEIQIF